MKKLTFSVELSVMNKTQIVSHYILVRAKDEDVARRFAIELYEKKQKAVGDVIVNAWVEPFDDEDDFLIIV